MFSHSVMSDSVQPHGLEPGRLLLLWDSLSKNTKWVASSISGGKRPEIFKYLSSAEVYGSAHCCPRINEMAFASLLHSRSYKCWLYGNSGGKKSEKSSSQASGPIAQEEHQRRKWYWVANRQSCIRFQGARRQGGSNDKIHPFAWESKWFCLHFKVQELCHLFPLDWKGWRRAYCARVPFVGVLRLYRLCPAEWGDANHTHRVSWSFSVSELIL